MHARVFTYGLDRHAVGAAELLRHLGEALACQPGYRGRLLIAAAGTRLIDWQLHDCQGSAIRSWSLFACALTSPALSVAIRLVGEGVVIVRDGLRAPGLPGVYARAAAPHYPPDDPPDGCRWSAILRAQPGYRGRLTVDAGYGRLLMLMAYDTADSYCAMRDGPAAQRYIATELAPRWTAPTEHIGAGEILAADYSDCADGAQVGQRSGVDSPCNDRRAGRAASRSHT